jgi:L-threonylcarbamoyladenylate synthase
VRTRLLDAASFADLDEAARLLRDGRLVAFPTETVYGLGALALDPFAVRGIYAAKGRPAANPLIVHVEGVTQARALTTAWPAQAALLAAKFWPGPLTLVLPRASVVPDEIAAGGPTVALRVPSHPAARALLARAGAPLAAPSANRAEHVSPTTAAHVRADLDGRIDAIVDGGPCSLGIESTVLLLHPDGSAPPRLLRTGAISRGELSAALGVEVQSGPGPGSQAAGAGASPGMSARHYAPAGIVRLVPAAGLDEAARALSQAGHRVGALVIGGPQTQKRPAVAHLLRLPADAVGYARVLYASLRALEEQGCDAIILQEVPPDAAWDAISDRLRRASASA